MEGNEGGEARMGKHARRVFPESYAHVSAYRALNGTMASMMIGVERVSEIMRQACVTLWMEQNLGTTLMSIAVTNKHSQTLWDNNGVCTDR